eukprot:763077-Hanusia_phi.AAC.3
MASVFSQREHIPCANSLMCKNIASDKYAHGGLCDFCYSNYGTGFHFFQTVKDECPVCMSKQSQHFLKYLPCEHFICANCFNPMHNYKCELPNVLDFDREYFQNSSEEELNAIEDPFNDLKQWQQNKPQQYSAWLERYMENQEKHFVNLKKHVDLFSRCPLCKQDGFPQSTSEFDMEKIKDVTFIIQQQIKLQKSNEEKQKIYLKSILFIFDKFITIEKCLLSNNVYNPDVLMQIDGLFDTWIERLIKKSFNNNFLEEFNTSVNNSLDAILSTEHINIDAFRRCLSDDAQDTTLENGIFINIRNVFLMLARRFGLALPTPVFIVFSIIQYCGDAVCKNATNIETVLKILSKFYFMNDIMLGHIKSAIELYCSINKTIRYDKVLKFLLHQVDTYEQPEKNARKRERELNEYAINDIMENHNKIENEENEAEESPPKKKDYFSRRSGTMTRCINNMIKTTEEFVTEKINSLNLDGETTSVLLGTMIAVKKSIQIEGWDGFIRSFNRHARLMLGEKFPGKTPETPFKKLISGKVFIRLNRHTFLANMTVLLPFAYPMLMKHVSKYLEE